jgi:hypothetical protein
MKIPFYSESVKGEMRIKYGFHACKTIWVARSGKTIVSSRWSQGFRPRSADSKKISLLLWPLSTIVLDQATLSPFAILPVGRRFFSAFLPLTAKPDEPPLTCDKYCKFSLFSIARSSYLR